MIKSQDCMLLIKLLANPGVQWSQRQFAEMLGISLSETNASIKRLIEAGLLRKSDHQLIPIIAAAEEFLISGIKYLFPVKLGEYIRGIPTGVGASLFRDKIVLGDSPIPVWPDAHGDQRGVALVPIHPAVPKSVRNHPDEKFYELLVLIDVIRSGRPRERNLAIKLLKDRLTYEK